MPIVVAVLLLLMVGVAPASARTVEIGTAINNGGFASGDGAYRSALLRYDAFTAESAMKMLELQPSRGAYSFARADSMVSWARANGRKIHGHNLIWCSDTYTPGWVVNGSWTRASLLAVMQDHIRRVMARWKGQIASWDVVNEAIAADGTMRDCVWRRVIGPDWVEQAFRTARAADPAAKLYLNEFGADTANAAFNGTEALARDFKARGVPLDGIGLQYHVYGRQPFQYVTEDVLRRVGALGLTAHISELDSTTSPLGGTVAEKLARQGQAFQSIASACQAVPACTRVTTWGVSDAWSWRGPSEMAVALDSSYAPKPAWEGLVQELRPAAAPLGPPGQPGTVRTGVKYDRGTYLVSWGAALDAQGDPLTYRLEHMDADDTAFSPVATGIRGLDYRFSSDGFIEQQGTWRYRVRAADPTGAGAWRNYSGQVVVDRVSPPAARLVTDRAPAWQDWYRDGVEVRFTDGGDPALPDGSPGSGLDPASVPAPQLITTTGSTVVSGAGEDRSGNAAPPVSGTYRVDASAPVAAASTGSYQPGTWTRSSVTVTFACSDAGAGLAGPVPAPVVVSGEGAGQLRSADCADRVGHAATATSGAIAIDKSPPAGSLSCPPEVTVGSPASANWTASDSLSGLAGAASGSIALDTSRAGTFTASRAIADNVGHTATLSCTYRVVARPSRRRRRARRRRPPADRAPRHVADRDARAADRGRAAELVVRAQLRRPRLGGRLTAAGRDREAAREAAGEGGAGSARAAMQRRRLQRPALSRPRPLARLPARRRRARRDRDPARPARAARARRPRPADAARRGPARRGARQRTPGG